MPRILATVQVVGLSVALLSACNSHRYYAEAMQYHAIAQSTLIARGICASGQDCQSKALLFAEGGEFSLGFVAWGGAYVNLYQTQDAALVEELVAKFKALHHELKQSTVTLTVYSSKHGEPKVKFREIVVQ